VKLKLDGWEYDGFKVGHYYVTYYTNAGGVVVGVRSAMGHLQSTDLGNEAAWHGRPSARWFTVQRAFAKAIKFAQKKTLAEMASAQSAAINAEVAAYMSEEFREVTA
jgi:hypothetical protein